MPFWSSLSGFHELVSEESWLYLSLGLKYRIVGNVGPLSDLCCIYGELHSSLSASSSFAILSAGSSEARDSKRCP